MRNAILGAANLIDECGLARHTTGSREMGFCIGGALSFQIHGNADTWTPIGTFNDAVREINKYMLRHGMITSNDNTMHPFVRYNNEQAHDKSEVVGFLRNVVREMREPVVVAS